MNCRINDPEDEYKDNDDLFIDLYRRPWESGRFLIV